MNRETIRPRQINHAGRFLPIFVLFSFTLLVGCKENPGTWDKDRIRVEIIPRLELTDAEVQVADDGRVSGSGTREGGETVTFTITQDPEQGRMSWDAKGDRGFVEKGFYELK